MVADAGCAVSFVLVLLQPGPQTLCPPCPPSPQLCSGTAGGPEGGEGGATQLMFYLPAGSCVPTHPGQAAAGACRGIAFPHTSLPSTRTCLMHPTPHPKPGGPHGPPRHLSWGSWCRQEVMGVAARAPWRPCPSPRATTGTGEPIQDPL